MPSTSNDAAPELSTDATSATPKFAEGSVPSPKIVWIDRNAVIHLLVLAIAIAAAVFTGRWWLALAIPLVFLAITEVLCFASGLQIYSHSNRVRRAYEWFDIHLDGAYGKGRDLTEAYFDGDRSKPYAQALSDKFDNFIELLGLQPGHRLLDVGCGYGDFIVHARSDVAVRRDRWAAARRTAGHAVVVPAAGQAP